MPQDNFSSKINKIKLSKNILFLGGPIGPFFRNFANLCQSKGSNTYKINFSLGEQIFFIGKNATLYSSSIANWPDYLIKYIKKNNIEQIFLFSDAVPPHAAAINVARKMNIPAYVFEQGYIRPNRITVELYGVNGSSNIKNNIHNLKDYKELTRKKEYSPNFIEKYVKSGIKVPFYVLLCAWGLFFTKYLNKNVRELVSYNLVTTKDSVRLCFIGVLLISSKLLTPINRIIFLRRAIKNLKWTKSSSKKFFILILQLPEDSQIQRDSEFRDMHNVIDKTLCSFSKYSLENQKLLIKHHPEDKIFNNYKSYIYRLCDKYNINHKRIKYIFDIHLPTTFDNALGCITVNSSAGFSALFHKTSVCCLSDKAIYNIPGLTHQDGLDSFWKNAKDNIVDRKLFNSFRNYVDYNTQITGPGFYTKFNKNRFEELFDF